MEEIVKIIIQDQTQALATRDLNTILVLSVTKAIAYQEASDITSFTGVVSTDAVYTQLENVFKQYSQMVALYGVNGGAVDADVTASLNELDKDNFTFVVMDSLDTTLVEEVKDWCSTNEKFFGFTPAIANGTTIADDATAIGNAITLANSWNDPKAIILCHKGTLDATPKQYDYASAFMGRFAPVALGTTSAYKQTVGTPINMYSNSDITTLFNSDKINGLRKSMGVYFNWEGRTTFGTYLDNEYNKLWLKVKLQEALTGLLIRTNESSKLGFDLDSKTKIHNEIQNVVTQAENGKIIVVNSTTITVPSPDELPINDKGERVWTNIKVSSIIVGAVHRMEVTYLLTLE